MTKRIPNPRTPVNIEVPSLSIDAAHRMRELITDALRIYADDLGLAHDVDAVKSAYIPTMTWLKITFESNNVALQIECEALLHARSQREGEGSHIVHLNYPKRIGDLDDRGDDE